MYRRSNLSHLEWMRWRITFKDQSSTTENDNNTRPWQRELRIQSALDHAFAQAASLQTPNSNSNSSTSSPTLSQTLLPLYTITASTHSSNKAASSSTSSSTSSSPAGVYHHLWCFALKSSSCHPSTSSPSVEPASSDCMEDETMITNNTNSSTPSSSSILSSLSLDGLLKVGLRRLTQEQSGSIICIEEDDSMKLGPTIACPTYPSNKQPRLATLLQLFDTSLRSYWRRKIDQMTKSQLHQLPACTTTFHFDPTLLETYDFRFFIERAALKVTFTLKSEMLNIHSSQHGPDATPTQLNSTLPWGQLYHLRSEALLDLIHHTRGCIFGVFTPSSLLQRSLAEMTPSMLAVWCSKTPTLFQSHVVQPMLLWIALMAIRSGMFTRKEVRHCFPQLDALYDQRLKSTLQETSQGLSRIIIHPVHSSTPHRPQQQAFEMYNPSATPHQHRTPHHPPGTPMQQLSSHTQLQHDSAATSSDTLQPRAKRTRWNPETMTMMDEDISVSMISGEDGHGVDDGASSMGESVEFVLPKERQNYLTKYLPIQPTYEPQLPNSSFVPPPPSSSSNQPSTSSTLLPIPPSTLSHLYFPSVYSAQLTALTLQYNDSPATTAHHAFANIQPIPQEFKKKANGPTTTLSLPHAPPALIPRQSMEFDANQIARIQQQAHQQPQHQSPQHPLPSQQSQSAANSGPHSAATHTPTHNYQSPHSHASHASHHTPLPPSQQAPQPFRPHIPTASVLLHRPPIIQPTHSTIARDFLIPVREKELTKEEEMVAGVPKASISETNALNVNGSAAAGETSRKRKSMSSPLPSAELPTTTPAPSTQPPPLNWTDLPPPPFCFFPWTNRVKDAHATTPTATTSTAKRGTKSKVKITILDDSSSDEDEDMESSSSDSDDEESKESNMNISKFSNSSSSDASTSTSRPPIELPLHLCRLIQQQALAPLSNFVHYYPNTASSSTATADSKPTPFFPSSGDAGWLTITPSVFDLDSTEEHEHIRAKHMLTLTHMLQRAFNAEPDEQQSPTTSMSSPVEGESKMDMDDGNTQLVPIRSTSKPSYRPQYLPATVNFIQPFAPILHHTHPPSVHLINEPRLLLTFEDTPGHDELRSYPPAILNWFDRASVKPFNPNLPGCWDRPYGQNQTISVGSSATSMQKNLLFMVVPPIASFLDPNYILLDGYFANLSATYENCNFGKHTNLLTHSAPPNAPLSSQPRSCIVDVHYARPHWLHELTPNSSPRQFMPFTPMSSPLPPDFDHSPMNHAPNSGHGPHSSPHPSSNQYPLPNQGASTPQGNGHHRASSPVHSAYAQRQNSQFPHLLDIHPPRDGMNRYYQGLVWSILSHLCGIVRNKELAGSASGSGSLVNNNNPSSSSTPSSSSSSQQRTLPAPLDMDRFDSLLIYVVVDEHQPHSLALLSHYMSYLTEPGKLLQEVEAFQELYHPHHHHHQQHGQHHHNQQQHQTPTHPPSLQLQHSDSLYVPPTPSPGPTNLAPPCPYEILFSEHEKETWSTALQNLEHLNVCLHFVPSLSLHPLTPWSLRSRSLQVYQQVCRLSDKVSLFVSSADGASMSASVGLSASNDTNPQTALQILELPPFPVWYEPVAILERAHKLPAVWTADWKEELPPPPSSSPSATPSGASKLSLQQQQAQDTGYALHMSYAFVEHANCLIAALTDERGVIVHSVVLPVTPPTTQTYSHHHHHHHHAEPTPTPVSSTSGQSPASVLASVLSRFLRDHLKPLLLILPRTVFAKHIRLVIVKLGSEMTDVDREAWMRVGHEWKWCAMWKDERRTTEVCPSNVQPIQLPFGSAEIKDVFLLSFLPAPSPQLTRFTMGAPLLAPTSSPNASGTPTHSRESSFDVSMMNGGFSSPVSSSPTPPVFNLDTEVSRAKQLLSSTVGSKVWWQTRFTNAPTTTDPLTVSVLDGFGFGVSKVQTKHPKSSMVMKSGDVVTSGNGSSSALSSFISQIFLISSPASSATSSQRLTTKLAAQHAPHGDSASACAARVTFVAYMSALPTAATTSILTCTVCRTGSTAPPPSTAFLQSSLTKILMQWKSLAYLNQQDIDPALMRKIHSGRNSKRSGRKNSPIGSGEPVPHLPMHLAVLTRMHAMIQRL